MEVKTAEQLQIKKLDDWDREFYSNLWLNKEWVAVSDILTLIDDMYKSEDVWRYTAQECLRVLKKEIKSSIKKRDEKWK